MTEPDRIRLPIQRESFQGTTNRTLVFDIKPHLSSDQDELDLHVEAQRGHAAHSLSG